MKIRDFAVEIWMNRWETECELNLAETCVDSLTIAELLSLSGTSPEAALEELLKLKLTYGAIEGSERLRRAIASLYEKQAIENVVVAHGAAGANALVYETLVEPGDHTISVTPIYQQHISIPESYGARVSLLKLRAEDGFLPDLDALRRLVTPKTKLIAINNPNNPTGALMDKACLQHIAEIARGCGAWVVCDEVYRGTDQEGDGTTASMADLYEKGISTGSMSKTFSLAGLRLGWIVGPDELRRRVSIHRDYNTISVGRLNDHFATMALEHRDKVLARNRQVTRTNLAILAEWVAREPHIDWVKPKSGTTAFLKYDLAIPSEAFCLRLLQRKGVLLTPGSAMDVEGYLRIGYTNPEATLREGLSRMSQFLKEESAKAA
jgi:aspartate/methionine/tyrosine aminotransferase